ncbi:MAG: ASPIC/UnbV domain-containing protein, partial [Phycisphaerae bacterium]
RGAAFGDIDNDGDIDVIASYNNGPARLLLNQIGNRNPWLRVRLVGRRSNRDGIGARVTIVYADGRRRHRHVHRDGSYLSASDVRVHFGLGDAGLPNRIVAAWPEGRREWWPVDAVEREIVLTEGDGRPIE